jgi:hypothetical protein
MRWSRRCAPPIRGCRTAITAQGQLVRQKRLPHWDRNAPLPFAATGTVAWPEAKNTVLTAYRALLAEMAGDRRAVFHRSLDRCAGAAGQGAGRLRASDHAVGASLCAAELSGQAARRDDARP